MLQKNIFVSLLFSFILLCSAAVFPSMKTAAAQEETVLTETGLEGQLTLKALQALNNDQAEVFTHNDRVTLVSGTCSEEPVKSLEDAEKVVDSMIGLLGGDAKTHFEPWRTFTDAEGNRYYVFQQMYANTTVLGGAVKVIGSPAASKPSCRKQKSRKALPRKRQSRSCFSMRLIITSLN